MLERRFSGHSSGECNRNNGTVWSNYFIHRSYSLQSGNIYAFNKLFRIVNRNNIELAIEFEWNKLDKYFWRYLFDIDYNTFHTVVLQTSIYFVRWNAEFFFFDSSGTLLWNSGMHVSYSV